MPPLSRRDPGLLVLLPVFAGLWAAALMISLHLDNGLGVPAIYLPAGLAFAAGYVMGGGFLPLAALVAAVVAGGLGFLGLGETGAPTAVVLGAVRAVVFHGGCGALVHLFWRRQGGHRDWQREAVGITGLTLVVGWGAALVLVLIHDAIPLDQHARLRYVLMGTWLGEVNGVLVVAPALVLAAARLGLGGPILKPWRRLALPKRRDLAAHGGLLILLPGMVVLLPRDLGLGYALMFLLLVPMAWIAVRGGLAAAAIQVLVAVALVYGTAVSQAGVLPWLEMQTLQLGLGVTALLVGALSSDLAATRRNLARREVEFRSLLEHAPDVIFRIGRDCRFRYISPAIEAYSGVPPAGWLGRRPRETAMFPDVAEQMEREIDHVIGQGQARIFDIFLPGLDGGRYFQIRLVPEPERDGGMTSILGVGRDITERLQNEAVRQRNEDRLQALAECANDWFWSSDAQGRVVSLSERFEAVTGLDREQAVGQDLLAGLMDSPHDGEQAVLIEALAERRAFRNLTALVRSADGRGRWIALSGRPMTTAAGAFDGYIGTATDVTAQVRARLAEQQRQRLEALGELAGGVAHELNNLLQPMVMLATMGQEDAPQGSRAEKALGRISQAAEQAGDIVHNVLTFSRPDEAPGQPVAAAKAVRTVLGFLRDILPQGISLNLTVAETVGDAHIGVAPTPLIQVMTNLLTNAADASTRQGLISITLDRVWLDEQAAGPLSLLTGDYIRLTVTDQGCGMEPAILAKVFEPFFTTKEIGAGTGLGLSVAYGLVRKWGGTITAESELGQGSTFTVFVPAVTPVAPGEGDSAWPKS